MEDFDSEIFKKSGDSGLFSCPLCTECVNTYYSDAPNEIILLILWQNYIKIMCP